VKAFKNGTRCVSLKANTLREHPAFRDGIIQETNGTYWLEEPVEEKAKPRLVLFVDAEPEEALSKKMRALAILAEHPEWSDKRIAAEVPCGRQTLYTWPEFVETREALRNGRAKYQRTSTRGKHEMHNEEDASYDEDLDDSDE
jgi:hypothetical protein